MQTMAVKSKIIFFTSMYQLSKPVLLQCWIKCIDEDSYDINEETTRAPFLEQFIDIQQEESDEDVTVAAAIEAYQLYRL